MANINGEGAVKLAENGYELIKRLQKGEKVLCEDCHKGYYITSAKDTSKSYEFACEKCGSVIRISPNIIVE